MATYSNQDVLGLRCTWSRMYSEEIKMYSDQDVLGDQEIKMYSAQDVLGDKDVLGLSVCTPINMYSYRYVLVSVCNRIDMYLDQYVLGSKGQDFHGTRCTRIKMGSNEDVLGSRDPDVLGLRCTRGSLCTQTKRSI
jgi:hypothetical protein